MKLSKKTEESKRNLVGYRSTQLNLISDKRSKIWIYRVVPFFAFTKDVG